jgi:hypothetical protein
MALLGKLDRVDARIKRQIARGATAESLRAARTARKVAWKKECAPFQKRLNAYHAAWVAAGMLPDFPKMADWEAM